jgi:TRAP-type C4-dicarboxylate transport system permease small subunit
VRLLRALHAAARLAAVAMFACVFAIFCLKIAARYVAHDTMAWADEVSILLFMWIVFWSNALLLRERDHIRFDLVTVLLPPAGQRAFAILRALLLGGIFLYALPATADYVLFLWRERTAVLGIRLDLAYSCFILFVAAVVLRAAIDLFLLLSPRWRAHV